MEDLFEFIVRGFAQTIGAIIRFLIFLIWDLFIHIIAWYIGWPICRLLTLNRFPQESIKEYNEASLLSEIIVCIVGVAFLCGLLALITRFLA